MTSEARHASMYDMAPPFEQPVAWMRLLSMHALLSRCVIMALVKATSSATVTQQPPAFHPGLPPDVLGSPCGNTVMNPWLSPTLRQREAFLHMLAVPPSPWKSNTTG